MDKNAINEFSIKWIEKFKNKNLTFHDLFESADFPDECIKLNFEMDCCKMFVEAYGKQMLNVDYLEKNITKLDDIKILGSGIFSNWRYFNHWANCNPTEEDIKWFILTLTRLAELSKD